MQENNEDLVKLCNETLRQLDVKDSMETTNKIKEMVADNDWTPIHYAICFFDYGLFFLFFIF